MYKRAIEILKIFHDNGYEAYIVGGYPRDYLLGIRTKDIDICTNASPMEIIKIFDVDGVSDIKYGSVKVIYKNYKYDVTTFRKDIKYEDNRRPIKIKYVNDLKKDLVRRDFTINTICIDKDENIINMLNGIEDISNKVIKTVGNPRYRLKEDSLRILRAIRFATILDFKIDYKTGLYIKKYGYLLSNLSLDRKKEELSKIFSSVNKERARELLLEYDLCKYLGIKNLDNVIMCDDIMGVWSQLEYDYEYPWLKNERDMIKDIRDMCNSNIDDYSVYKYGLYVSQVVGSIKGVSNREINKIYKNLVIYSRRDICINGHDICDILGNDKRIYIKDIINDIEKKIVYREIDNGRDVLLEYIKEKY